MKTPVEAIAVDPLEASGHDESGWQMPVPVSGSATPGRQLKTSRSCRLAALGFGAYGTLGLAAAIGQAALEMGAYRPTQAVGTFFHGASLILPGLAIIGGFLAWHSRTARVLTCSVIAGLAVDATLDRWSLPSIDHGVLQLGLTVIMLVGSVILWRRAGTASVREE